MPSRLLEIWLWGNWLTLLFCISSPVLLRCPTFFCRLHCLPRYLLGLHLLQSSWDPWQDTRGSTSLWGRCRQEQRWERPHHGNEQHPAHEGHQCLRHFPTLLRHEKQPPPEQRETSSGCNPGLFWMLLSILSHPHTRWNAQRIPKLGLVVVFNGF